MHVARHDRKCTQATERKPKLATAASNVVVPHAMAMVKI